MLNLKKVVDNTIQEFLYRGDDAADVFRKKIDETKDGKKNKRK